MTGRSTAEPSHPAPSVTSAGSRYAAMLLGSSLVAGLAVYGYLVLAKRGMTLEEWSQFSAFWSVALVVGFGFFLPLEQESSRLLRPSTPRAALRPLVHVAAWGTLAACVALGVGAPALLKALRQQQSLLLLLALLAAVSALQFFTRGVMLGLGHRRAYVGALATDGLLRVGLAAALLLAGMRGELPFAVALLTAILLAHLLPLAFVLHQTRTVAEPPVTGPGVEGRDDPVGDGKALRGWLRLLPASLAAQVIQNGAPFAVALVATGAEVNAAGPFLAAFTVARIPLFLAVPIQSALVPPLAKLVREGQSHRVVSLVSKLAGGTIGVALLGAAAGLLVGRPIVALLFGPELVVPAGDMALMIAGVCVHVGLLVVTQALVALDLHGQAGTAWTAALAAAVMVFVGVQPLLLRAELAFLVGSLVGGATATLAMWRSAGRPARHSPASA